MASCTEVFELSNSVRDEEYWGLVEVLSDPGQRWFLSGQGRSGLVAAMVAMRLMHIGRRCHVAGEATAPAIRDGDGLLIVSGSGETATTVQHAETAARENATVVAVTRASDSRVASLCKLRLQIPVLKTAQLGGDLFEQMALIVLDSVVNTLAEALPDANAELRSRHANLQ